MDRIVNKIEKTAPKERAADLLRRAQLAEEVSQSLSKQLNLERLARQIISKMHVALDRDVLLQHVVDALGKGLSVNRCLVVRTDMMPPNVVTHEYAEADISPLGLGRTSKVPAGLVDYFKREGSCGFLEYNELKMLPGLDTCDRQSLADSAISTVAGAPISLQGNVFGVIVLLNYDLPKPWTIDELELVALIAEQTGVVLNHCETFLHMKDQLFHMNLIGNLSQQLTDTLELVAKNLRTDGAEDRAKKALDTTPLSFRELEVLKLIASGCANREIATRLFLTESTVELHASRIRKKLKLKSRTALVKYACDNGLA